MPPYCCNKYYSYCTNCLATHTLSIMTVSCCSFYCNVSDCCNLLFMIPLLLVYIQMFVATFIKSTVTFPCLLQQSYTNNLELFVATVTIMKPAPQASGCSFKLLNICCSNDKPTFFPPSSGCCNTCCNLPLAIYPIILLLLQHLLPNLPGPDLPVATIPLLIIYLYNYLVHMLQIFIIFFLPFLRLLQHMPVLQLATCHLSYYIIVVATFTTKPAGPGPACCNRPIINNIFTQLLSTCIYYYYFHRLTSTI